MKIDQDPAMRRLAALTWPLAWLCLVIVTLTGCTTVRAPDAAVTAPTPLKLAVPNYPRASVRAGHEGEGMLRLLVRQDGTVGKVEVQTSSGFPALDKAAVEAAGQSRYNAARTATGEAVEAWATFPFVFALHRGPVTGPIRGPESGLRTIDVPQRRLPE
jgi:TonB family protein